LDHSLLPARVHLLDLLEQTLFDVRPLLQTPWHVLSRSVGFPVPTPRAPRDRDQGTTCNLLLYFLFYFVAFPRFRPRTINRLEAFFGRRVFTPSFRPQGETGWRPPELRPSPPPSGWSTGFITTPRTFGRRPRQRFAPALPIDCLLWSTLPTWP